VVQEVVHDLAVLAVAVVEQALNMPRDKLKVPNLVAFRVDGVQATSLVIISGRVEYAESDVPLSPFCVITITSSLDMLNSVSVWPLKS
jgi:hypothetical protein